MIRRITLAGALCCSLGAALLPKLAAEPSAGAFLLAANNKVFIVDRAGKVLWQFSPKGQAGILHATMQDNGRILYVHRFGVVEISQDKKVTWKYEVARDAKKNEIDSCLPLPGGGVAILDSGNNRILEIGRDQKTVREICLPSKVPSPHGRYRSMTRTAEGGYLVTMNQGNVLEYGPDGKLAHTFKVRELAGSKGRVMPFGALRLPGGATLLSTGFHGSFLEVGADGNVGWRLGRDDLPGVAIHFAAVALRLPNGNTVFCNSDWHLKEAARAQVILFELNSERKLVWTLKSAALEGQVGFAKDRRTGLKEFRVTDIQALTVPALRPLPGQVR